MKAPQILTVTRKYCCSFEITDQCGNLVEGPFDTNAAAWSVLDRIDRDTIPGRSRSNKVLWGKPDKPAKRNSKKASKRKEEHRMKVNAAKAPGRVRSVAAAKFDPAGEGKFRDYKLGTFGAASEVKRMNPATYLAEKAAKETTRAVNNVEGGSSR
ncbi:MULTISPECIES: hypothetical protein [unclassified Rhizobium]|uniref:hypothetical protein n=1 Tax=unclassified Rhizobium TaxID=2613769 RepID=UPI0007EAE2B5|nr:MULTISPECIES: hypothetical protein [unclassified Rhizobium]ANM10380.1 hypothetical protein AMK05_CH01994 [Rhizobium sp. N324]ANM16865.1 hypothetical protein AMK06_CH01963 [Rhizobium sp. N541]ANM23250.1 hypothetical protein AMK07_CH01960 [Rhizobium sp. N941]